MEVPPEKVCPTITPTPVITCPEVTNATPCPSCPEVPTVVPETSTSCRSQEPEPEVDHCRDDPCLNGGTCYNTTAGYICLCPEYFSGNEYQTGNKEIN